MREKMVVDGDNDKDEGDEIGNENENRDDKQTLQFCNLIILQSKIYIIFVWYTYRRYIYA